MTVTSDQQGNALFRAAETMSIAGRDVSRRALLQEAVRRWPAIPAAQPWHDRAIARKDRPYIRDLGLSLALNNFGAELPQWLIEARDEANQNAPYCAAELRARLAGLRPGVPSDRSGPLCYVLHMSLPESGSGYAVRSHHLIGALKKGGVDLHVVTRLGFPGDSGHPTETLKQVVDGISYHRLPHSGVRRFNNMLYTAEAARALIAHLAPLKPRAIMAASNHENAAPALLAARYLGVPFIYEMRGFWELSGLATRPENAKTKHFANVVEMESELARQADLVFTLTEAMRGELRRRGVGNANVHILPNAADPDTFHPAPRDSELLARLGISADMPVIGYVGSFTGYEGLDDIVRAGVELHRRGLDFRLLLIGSEPAHLKDQICPELREIAEAGGIADKLIMPGRVPVQEVERWYSLIDIVPIPRKDLQVTRLVPPLKPLEAMAMEKSVVVTDLPALKETVSDQETGIVVARDDPAALADALGLLIEDADLRRALGARARELVIRDRNWDAVVGRLRNALDLTLSGSAPAGSQ